MTKRALITGITGMVGSHLLDYLLRHTDWEIHGMLRWRSPLDNISGHLDDINAGGRIKLHYADLRDTMAIQNCVQASTPGALRIMVEVCGVRFFDRLNKAATKVNALSARFPRSQPLIFSPLADST